MTKRPARPAPVLAVEPSTGNVFADLQLSDPALRLAKARLAMAINDVRRAHGWTYARAAAVADLSLADMRLIARGRLTRLTAGTLLDALLRCGVAVEIPVRS